MEMEEVVKEFLVESYENLDQLDRDLVALEEAPGPPDLGRAGPDSRSFRPGIP